MRNYGYLVDNKPAKPAPDGAVQITGVRDPVLATGHESRTIAASIWTIRTWSARRFSWRSWRSSRKSGQMPRLIVMRLGNDHTSGTAAGKIAPLSAAADNDYALGMLVEGVSQSRFWRRPRSSCWKTTRRTGRITWIRTARRRS